LAGGPLGESVGCTEGGAGVWARVGKRWAERGNIGFSEDAAPVKARAMSYGLAFGSLSVGLSVGLSVCLCPTDLPGVRTCLGYFLPRVRPSRDLHLHLPPKPFSAIIVHLCRLCCARVNTRARARVHTHTHTHTHTTVGKGLETLARELDISVAEVESWITAFSAAFPAVGRKVSALRRGGGGRADGGGGEGGGTGRERELRSISGRLCVDSRSLSSLLLCAYLPAPLPHPPAPALPFPPRSHSVPFATLNTLPLPTVPVSILPARAQ